MRKGYCWPCAIRHKPGATYRLMFSCKIVGSANKGNAIESGSILVDNISLAEGSNFVFEEDFEKVGPGIGPGIWLERGTIDDSSWFLIQHWAVLSTNPDSIILPKLSTYGLCSILASSNLIFLPGRRGSRIRRGIAEGGAGPWRRDFENGIVFVNSYRAPANFDAIILLADSKEVR